MSFGTPIVYAQPHDNLSIPSQFIGDDLKSFGKGARSVVRVLPTSSGSNISPSSSALFTIPTGGYSYIKPNSFYLRGKCSVTITGTTNVGWYFAGASSGQSVSTTTGTGGASSLINRVNIQMGGTSLSYSNYNHFRNAVLPHCASKEYIETELRQLEYAGVTKLATTDVADSKDIFFSIPLWLPCFNSNQAFPALLLSSPITMEIVTEALNSAISSITNAVSNYALSELALVYETVEVSAEFKNSLLASKANSYYNIACNDWMSVGPMNVDASNRFQIGCGLSSLKSVLFTFQLTDDVSAVLAKPKKYTSNGLFNFSISVNNQVVSIPNINNDSICYAEMNRALQRINDFNVVSYLSNAANTDATNLRNSYTSHNFLAGVSTAVFSDWGYANTGIDAQQVTLDLIMGGALDTQWQVATATASASNLYIFFLYDSVISVSLADGTVNIRK